MNSTFLLRYVLIISYVRISRAFETVKFTVVTSFPELDQFYKDIKSDARRSERAGEQTDDTSTKLQVCHFIFSSSFFDMNGEDPVPLNTRETYKELKSQPRRHIFYEVYGGGGAKASKNVLRRLSSIGHDQKPAPPKYYDENEYRERRVWIQRYPAYESLFTCLTRERLTGEIKRYYVSKVYNVNTHFSVSNFSPVAGCFVFTHDRRHDIVLRALAEEAARPSILLFTTMERLYTYRRTMMTLARTPEEDPVCRLTKSEKLRLCNQIMSRSEFEEIIRFYPKFENVEEQCRRRTVDFDEPDVRLKSRGTIHEEWMYGCKTLILLDDSRWTEHTFYLSRGYGIRRVILYGELDGRLYIIHFAENIGVWYTLVYFDVRTYPELLLIPYGI